MRVTLLAFFSGQDVQTLKLEGDKTNCFVSLIVDTAGKYVAAVTRKVQEKTKVTIENKDISYEFFGDGKIEIEKQEPITEESTNETIQYFMLDVEREEVNNPLEYLDSRFQEIEHQKEEKNKTFFSKFPSVYIPKSEDTEEIKEIKETKTYKDKDVYGDLFPAFQFPKEEKQLPKFYERDEDKAYNFTPNPECIKAAVARMLTCSLSVKFKDFDIKSWVKKHMLSIYDRCFSGDSFLFQEWCTFIVEFLVMHYSDENSNSFIEIYGEDEFYSEVANAIAWELKDLGISNEYIDCYVEELNRFY